MIEKIALLIPCLVIAFFVSTILLILALLFWRKSLLKIKQESQSNNSEEIFKKENTKLEKLKNQKILLIKDSENQVQNLLISSKLDKHLNLEDLDMLIKDLENEQETLYAEKETIATEIASINSSIEISSNKSQELYYKQELSAEIAKKEKLLQEYLKTSLALKILKEANEL